MSKILFRFFSQTSTDDYECLQLSSVGTVSGSWSVVDKYLTFTVSKGDVFGSVNPWNPLCCGFVTVEENGSINNYSVNYATQVGADGRLTFHCNCTA